MCIYLFFFLGHIYDSVSIFLNSYYHAFLLCSCVWKSSMLDSGLIRPANCSESLFEIALKQFSQYQNSPFGAQVPG